MLIKLLKEIVNDRLKKHNFKKVVDKTYTDQGFIVDGEVDEFYIDNDRYTITPIKSIADCNKFEIINDKVYLEEMKQLGSSLLVGHKEIEKTCLIFDISIDHLEEVEY